MPSWLSSLVPSQTVSVLALQLLATTASPALAPQAFQKELPSREVRLAGPATRAANLSPAACKSRLKVLDTGHVVTFAGASSGIASPTRIKGPVGELTLQVPAPKFSFGLLDCRLAVLLLELAPELTKWGVKSLRIDGFYRKGARIGGKKGKKSQHAYGLALDLVTLEVMDPATGERVELDVKRDFYGKLGAPTCGPEARLHVPDTASPLEVRRSLLLRNFVCDLARGGWFHHMLTPNHDRAHESHLHLDIKRDSHWLSIE